MNPGAPFGRAGSAEHVITIEVVGRPATFATSGEAAWKQAVRNAAVAAGAHVVPGRLSLRVQFRLPQPDRAGQGWDLDNLLKPTVDALDAVLGSRPQRGRPQADDERVDHIDAWKRPASPDELVGATVDVYRL
jgi:Holliday junction resolvase RusA-like endonuclease